jgi:membrane protease YdiL (CAAX protease family)
VVVEFGIRAAGGAAVWIALWERGGARPAPGLLVATEAVTGALAFGVLGVWFDRCRRRAGLGLTSLGYRLSWRAAAAGAVTGAGLFASLYPASIVDEHAFGPVAYEAMAQGVRDASLWAMVVLLLENGVLAPVVEEFAWRGFIQSVLTAAWSPGAALLATAALFAAKHVVVDLSVSRTTVLVAASLVLGAVRWRWGTGASTIAHVVLNLPATAAAIHEARSL